MELSLEGPAYWQLLTAYVFGFLSSFTPCVFPLIPITLSLFGARDDINQFKRFLLSLSYVAGICVTYTTLGMISARTGAVFGSFLGNPVVICFLSAFLILMVLFTLDIVQISSLSRLQTAAGKVGGKGFGGAFLMGAVSGVVAAPCIGPALVAILGVAAKSGNAYWGALLLFIYSLGLGTLFIALGTFSGLARSLPRAGNWMYGVKFLMAVALMMVAILISERYLRSSFLIIDERTNVPLLIIMALVAVALSLVAFRRNHSLLKFAASCLAAISIYELVLPQAHSTWISDFDLVLQESKSQAKPAMVDLYADWCTACKEFDLKTFPDPLVKAELENFVLGRIDFTDISTPQALHLTEKYSVPGLPCILFLKAGSDGEEIPNTRITGFVEAKEFSEHLRKVIDER